MAIIDVLENREQYYIQQGNALDVLKTMPDNSIQCVVTSPPYWGLRTYGTEGIVWGGDKNCLHEYNAVHPAGYRNGDTKPGPLQSVANTGRESRESNQCSKCGAWKGELGLEPSVNMFVEHLCIIFDEVKRVLRTDGVFWLNVSDSYIGGGPSGASYQSETTKKRNDMKKDGNFSISNKLEARGLTYKDKKPVPPPGMKAKDLSLMPFRLAIALQDRGWYVRSDIAWCKRSTMPESVKDRPTRAWEHIFMLTKSSKYYYDSYSVRDYSVSQEGHNLWDYWLLGPEPFKGAHFATFPTELVRRCVVSSTPEYGCCSVCRTPYKRVIENKNINKIEEGGKNKRIKESGFRNDGNMRIGDTHVESQNWIKQCKCDSDIIAESIVLDLFIGSGTTALVALQNNCRAIGIELNEEYIDIANKRITNGNKSTK